MPIILPQQDPTNPTLWPTVAGKTTVGINLAGQWTLKQADGTIVVLAAGTAFHDQNNSGGNGSIAPTGQIATEEITFSGGGGVRQFSIAATGVAAGAILIVSMLFPTVTGIRIQIFNANLSGTLLTDYTSDGTGAPVTAMYFFDGTNWNQAAALAPAN